MKSVIIEPIVTEKAVNLSSVNKYIFKVDKKATKSGIKKEIVKIFKVKVDDVNIINQRGKQKRRGRILGHTVPFKKAIVTLKKGEKIKELEVK
jgi:large subunit ribosomal protein L23|uniref:Large ribosomal subunit protein uL23 n=1 Tax=candidate division CPR3 bacterium TaxID=2268181 RepID=A0A7V3N4E1_UNCC3